MSYVGSVLAEKPIWTSIQWTGALGCVLIASAHLWGLDGLTLAFGVWCGIDTWIDNLIRGMNHDRPLVSHR